MTRRPAAVVILLLCCLSRTILASNGGEHPRSIDLAAGSIENGLDNTKSTTHSHEAMDKPTKFDLDVSQYTETDDEELLEMERRGSSTTMKAMTSTEATTPEEEVKKIPKCENGTISVKCIERRLESFLRTISRMDTLNVTDTVQIVRKRDNFNSSVSESGESTLIGRLQRFAQDHVVKVKLTKDLVAPRSSRMFFFGPVLGQDKNTFLTGFGLGVLAFGLKKLLWPILIGVQIIKTLLVALFLPSIIGSIGKIVGKSVTSFAQSSQNLPPPGMEENYEFKDNAELYSDDYMQRQPLGTLPASAMYDETMLQGTQQQAVTKSPEIASRFAYVDPRLTHMNALHQDRYYTRHMVNPQPKRQDFKVFHEIPTSSLLLTNYDPFYSPLLSRLDAVFSRLGHNTESCREFAVCAMYRSPARYAPYSNLVSAQLSRELNELRRPSSDNPDVLRFFRYMKAAKDGQDGIRCEDAYSECDQARDQEMIRQNQAMLATYQDIDKLVHARKL